VVLCIFIYAAKRKKRYGSNERWGILKNRIGIDQRPAIVDTRSRVGDWEADTIIGKAHKQAIVSITERKSGLALIYKVDKRTKGKYGRCRQTVAALHF